MDLIQENELVIRMASDLNQARQALRAEKEAIPAARQQTITARKAQEILQLVAQAIQQKAHERIARVVSSCLSAVFDDPYSFRIDFERKRGQTEATFRFIRRGLEIDPMTASGGGTVDVASFALRAACLVMHRPRLSRLLCLDEPFRFLSAEYQPNIRTMLEELAGELGIQIVLVTHSEQMISGKVIRL